MNASASDAGRAGAGGASEGAWTRVRRRLARAPGPWLKPVVFAALAAPAVYLVYALFAGELGPDPVKELTHETGELALRFLVLSLALTPLRQLLKAAWPIRLRRMVGLFAFFYAALHVAIWIVLDQELDPGAMLADIVRRPYVLAGTAAFLIMVPLAATSTKGTRSTAGRALGRAAPLGVPRRDRGGRALRVARQGGHLRAVRVPRPARGAVRRARAGAAQDGMRSLTVARSSCSSFSLARILSPIASDTSSPCTISQSPPLQRTGNEYTSPFSMP